MTTLVKIKAHELPVKFEVFEKTTDHPDEPTAKVQADTVAPHREFTATLSKGRTLHVFEDASAEPVPAPEPDDAA